MGMLSLRRRSWGADRRPALPPRFEAAGEALASGSGGGPSVLEACRVAGRDLADAGASLGESIEGLRSTTRLVRRRDPSFEELRTLAVGWSEATLGYLHGLSCSDPLTGLSTLAHLRERVGELYRDGRDQAGRHAFVVTQLPIPPGLDRMASARRLTLLGQAARGVFPGWEPIARVGASRVVVVAARDAALPARVSLLRRMVEHAAPRVWIEGLPGTDASAVRLLDELARGG